MTHLIVAMASLGFIAADPNKDDLAKFQGTWSFQSMEVGGNPVDLATLKDLPLVIKDNTWSQGGANGTFTIDATKTPKTIDMTFTVPSKGTVVKGIYELSG